MRETETRVQHEGTVRECSCQSTILESNARVHRVESIESRVQYGRQRDESTVRVYRIESSVREYRNNRREQSAES